MPEAGWYLEPVVGPVRQTWGWVWAFLPRGAAALLLLIFGLVAARAVRTALESLGGRLKLDEHTSRAGLNEVLTRLGLGRSPTYAIGFGAYWATLAGFIVAAARALELEVTAYVLDRSGDFVGRLVVAILVAFAGLSFARLLSKVVTNAATANNLSGGATLSKACYGVVVVFTALLALEQLGLQFALVVDAVKILLASAGLAAGIAFGLAGRRRAAELLERLR